MAALRRLNLTDGPSWLQGTSVIDITKAVLTVAITNRVLKLTFNVRLGALHGRVILHMLLVSVHRAAVNACKDTVR